MITTVIVGTIDTRVTGIPFGSEMENIIKNELSYMEPGHERDIRFIRRLWDGKAYLFTRDGDGHTVPTGLVPRLLRLLDQYCQLYQVINNIPKWERDPDLTYLKESTFSMRSYQTGCMLALVKPRNTRLGGIVQACTGCHRKGQQVLMFDGTLKKVEDVVVGDLLMGPDSTPRLVEQLRRGVDTMYEVIPVKGKPFVVNKDHVLTLVRTSEGKPRKNRGGEITDVKLSDWLAWSAVEKHVNKLFRVPVTFTFSETLPLDPYFLGVLLGDGHIARGVEVTNPEPEIEAMLKEQAAAFGLHVRTSLRSENNPTHSLSATSAGGKENPITKVLRDIGVYGCLSEDKFIPNVYKTATREDRLELLAGLLDTDGSLSKSGFDFISKSEQLAKDLAYVARSLGLAAYVCVCTKGCQTGYVGTYYRVSISGDCSIIPSRVARKKAAPRQQIKDVLRTGFKVRELGVEAYYGFTLSEDGRYLLDDFTVTHNSGKTRIACKAIQFTQVRSMFVVNTKDLMYQAMAEFKALLGIEIGQIGDGKVNIQPVTVALIQSLCRALDITGDNKERIKGVDEAATKKAEVVQAVLNTKHVAFDECHGIAAKTAYECSRRFVNAIIVACYSASPWRDDGLDILIEAAGGNTEAVVTASDLIDLGFLVPPIINVLHLPDPDDRYEKRAYSDVSTYHEFYKAWVARNTQRNDLILDIVHKEVAQSSQIIILVKLIEHGDMLNAMIPGSVFLEGTQSGKKRKAAIERFRNRDFQVLIATSLGDQGLDVPSADVLILAGGGKSSTRALQRIGRVIRIDPSNPYKTEARVYDLVDKHANLKVHWYQRKKIYQTERRFEIREEKVTYGAAVV